MPTRRTGPTCWAPPGDVERMIAPPSDMISSRRLVCRDKSIVRCDGGWFMGQPPSWLEARARLGCQTASELGAPAVSSIPEQLPGHEPASARMGYEDERTS